MVSYQKLFPTVHQLTRHFSVPGRWKLWKGTDPAVRSSQMPSSIKKKTVLRFFSMLLRISQGVPLQELRRQPSQVCNEWMRFFGRACGQGIWNWNMKRLVRNVRNLGGLTMVYRGLGNFPRPFRESGIFCHGWERWTRKRLPVCKRLMMVDGNDLQTHRIWWNDCKKPHTQIWNKYLMQPWLD